jgi:hypothetical protein
MEIYELSQGERFLIETIREFRFLSSYRYEGSGFVVAGREYSVTFTNYSSSRSITIIWQETQDLNVIFGEKKFFGITSQDLSKIAKFKRTPTSLKTLAEIVQSDYMYLINP